MNKDQLKKKIKESMVVEAPEDDSLVTQLNKIMADSMIFYFKTHSFHWNVEGPNFSDYHAFFSTVYTQAFESVDPIAEYIRQLGSYAPNSLGQLISVSNLTELNSKPADAMEMFRVLKADNDTIMTGLASGRKLADAGGYTDISNFLDDLIGQHRKLDWMLNSLLK